MSFRCGVHYLEKKKEKKKRKKIKFLPIHVYIRSFVPFEKVRYIYKVMIYSTEYNNVIKQLI